MVLDFLKICGDRQRPVRYSVNDHVDLHAYYTLGDKEYEHSVARITDDPGLLQFY